MRVHSPRGRTTHTRARIGAGQHIKCPRAAATAGDVAQVERTNPCTISLPHGMKAGKTRHTRPRPRPTPGIPHVLVPTAAPLLPHVTRGSGSVVAPAYGL